ncbi:MAG: restriction endonuclease subunit S [Chloroflexi bacterium]|nr:restriction endonuclease subunit S [Chloroflexota bacterium]
MPKGEQLVTTKTAHPYIRAQDIRNGIISISEALYVKDDIFQIISRYTVETNDVCIVIVGANVGDVGIISPFLSGANLTENAVKLIDLKEFDSSYLRYCLLTNDAQEQMKLFAAGAAQPKLGLYKIKQIQVSHPPLKTQRKIAAVLSAYDDLIENNTRRIQILEEMAQTIYRQWFVEFKYPGHEAVPWVDSGMELGEIPQGWEVRKLGDECVIVMGQSPKSEYYNEEGQGLPFHQGVKDFGHRYPTDRVYCTVNNRIAESGDILFSVRAPVGRMNISNKRIVIGRGLSAIRHKNAHQWFILQQLREKFFQEDMIGGGTIFKSVTKDDMLNIELIVPTPKIEEGFEHLLKPISAQIANLTLKNVNLRTTRDLLLPRLVSGEVGVSGVENMNNQGEE